MPKKQGRPSVGYSWPYEANLPIPFAWLLEAVNATSDEEEFWVKIKSKFDSYSIVRPEYYKNFNEALAKYIEDTDLTSLSVKKKIYSKAKQSLESELVLIEVPNSVIAEETHQEINDGKKIKNYNEEESEPENISNIEHLFDRLNSKGTPLSPHDRIYSMIKAYWPVFEEKITELKEKGLLHLPDAEFVSLIIRAAITTAKDEKIHPPIDVREIRQIAKNTNNEYQKKDALENIFSEDKIILCCRLIDYWLLYSNNHDFGLPPFIRSEIAKQSGEVYLLLFWLAKRELETTSYNLDTAKYKTQECW